MKYLFLSVLFLATAKFCHGGPLRIQKRAVFYVANETACVVDDKVYSIDDPIPTDNPCETCRCRPPGFACVLVNCLRRLGCKPVEKPGQCCPDYICGCEYNGKMYNDGEEIPNSDDPCITCHCLGSSTVCSTGACPPPPKANCVAERVAGECCPRYTNCSYVDSDIKATTASDEPISVEHHPDEERSYPVKTELSKNPPFQEAPEKHYASVTLGEGFTPEIQDKGSSSQAPVEAETTPQSVQDADKSETDSSETNNKPQLLNTDSEIIDEAPTVEKKDPVGDDIAKSTVADSDGLIPTETNVSKSNTEIFADGAVEDHRSGPTTPTQDLPLSDPVTTQVPTKIEKDIETNTIEKRFRSLQNVTSENTTETTEKKEPFDAVTAKNTEINETSVTEVQEKHSTFQVTETTTPDTGSHTESLESVSKDASSNTESTTDAGKSLEKFHFAVEKIPVPESTVTAVVNVHEETTGPEVDGKVVTSVSPSDEQELSSETSTTKETGSSENVNEAEKSQSN